MIIANLKQKLIDCRDNIRSQKIIRNVEFVPFTNNPTEITQQCDIGLMCSLREAFGRVTIEYMMANLFAIGSNAGGTPELINDGEDGLLYMLDNPEELAEKINWVITNKDKANQMIMRGKRKSIEEFSIENTAKRVYKLYEEHL